MILLLLALAASPAHELQETTARIALRDHHVSVQLDVDLLAWLERVRGGRGELPVDTLAVADPEALAALRTLALEQLSTASIVVDGVASVPEAIRAPAAADVQRIAMERLVARGVDPHAHGERASFWLDLRADGPPDSVGIVLPESVGSVLVTFVQPASRLVSAGEGAMFTVPRAEATAPDWRPWALAGALALALLGVLVRGVYGRAPEA